MSLSGRSETLGDQISDIPAGWLKTTHSGPTPAANINNRLTTETDPTVIYRYFLKGQKPSGSVLQISRCVYLSVIVTIYLFRRIDFELFR